MLKGNFRMRVWRILQIGLTVMLFCGLAAAQKDEKPLTADDYYKRGLERINNNQCGEAVKDFSKAIELNPRDERFYKERGGCLTGVNNTEALADFDKAIKLEPNYAEAYLGRGLVYFDEFLTKGDSGQLKTKALTDFNKSILLKPQCAECFFNRAKFYFWSRESGEKVFGDLDKAVELEPRKKEYRMLRLTFNMALDEYGKVVSDCDALLELNPRDDDALYMRGQSYFALGKYQKAIEDYTLALEIKPISSLVFLGHRAKVYRAMGKIKEAEADEKRMKILQGQ